MAEKLKILLSEIDFDFWTIPFDFLGVKNCNVDECASISTDMSLKLGIKSKYVPIMCSYLGTPLCEVYLGSILSVLLAAQGKFSQIPDNRQRQAVETLITFFENIEDGGDHLKCLKKLQSIENSKMSEKQIQAVMACHLFFPLICEGEVIVDSQCYKTSSSSSDNRSVPVTQCPFCSHTLKPGNTNFGVKDLWHGRADMVIKAKDSRIVVMAVEDVVEDDEEHEDEPTSKKTKWPDDDCLREVKTIFQGPISTFLDKRPYKQAISQTLINAFLAVKHNKTLENTLIPSFLVCQNSVFIHFYNIKQDVLLVQSMPMYFFRGDVNYSAFFSVWMALNFFIFPLDLDNKFYSASEKSGFRHCLDDKGVLEKYENEIEEELSSEKEFKAEQFRRHGVPQKKIDELVAVYKTLKGEKLV